MDDDQLYDLFYALLLVVSDDDLPALNTAWWTGKTDVATLLALAAKYGLVESEAVNG